MSFIKRLASNDAGVIAIETLLTLPVYLFLLGFAIWISELTTGRSTLEVAQYTHLGLFGIRGMSNEDSQAILADATSNVANSQFASGTSGDSSLDWWRQVTVEEDTLTMNTTSFVKQLLAIIGGSDGQSSTTDLTLKGNTHFRYVRTYNGDWRGDKDGECEYGSFLLGNKYKNGQYENEAGQVWVNSIFNQLGPGENDMMQPSCDTSPFYQNNQLDVPRISYYRSHAKEYSQYLFVKPESYQFKDSD